MTKLIGVSTVVASAVVLVLGARLSSSAQVRVLPIVVTCRHDASESQEDRNRREQALALARAIHEAQGVLSERTGAYRPLSGLPKLPPVPRGFELRVYADADGYLLSLKDTLDPCRYAVFTDQAGLLYEKSPRDAALMAARAGE